MSNLHLSAYALLLLLCFAGLGGLFFFKDYTQKVSCLSVSYSSMLVLMAMLALGSSKASEALLFVISASIFFWPTCWLELASSKSFPGLEKMLVKGV